MANLIFTPTLYLQGTRYELPRPIVSLRIQDAWDYSRFKVPLRAGDLAAGRSQDGADVAVEGQIGTHAGILQAGESEMFATLEQMRMLLNSAGDADASLVLYRDDDSGDEHFLKQCSLVRFEYDLSDKNLFTYSLVLHAADPLIYVGVPF